MAREEEITICFTDAETTGFAPHEHYMIQIAMVKVVHPRERPLDLEVLAEKEWKILLPEGFDMPPEAAAINGYDEAVWQKEGCPRREVLFAYFDQLAGASFGGQNACFDWRFVQEEARRENISMPRLQHYSLFTVEMLARPLALLGYIENVKLQTMARFFNVGMQKHDALTDIRQTVEVYKRLLWLHFQGLSEELIQEAQQL